MATTEINEYYDATKNSAARSDLLLAISLAREPKIAIDCGCGAGSNTAHLLANDFVVHAFDIEPESIARCRERFKNQVELSINSFNTFSYPAASLVVADASLFFCPKNEFDEVWHKIAAALLPGGVFVGSFLGTRDTMAGPDYQKDLYWPNTLVFTEALLRPYFANFDINRWTEHESDGETAQGAAHHWHIYSIVAVKK